VLERSESLSLKNYNTFGIECWAKEIILLNDVEQLNSIEQLQDTLILGGGSNVLFVNDVKTKVVINQTKGISATLIGNNKVQLHIASGENWHDVVLYAVERNYGGIENLSLIPGSVGAAPMQNIGAYGTEIKDVLSYVDTVDIQQLTNRRFSNKECLFGYRDSIFKKDLKGQYFIEAIGITLSTANHSLNTEYGAIQSQLEIQGIIQPSVKDVSDAVISIRKSKLPDPSTLGNAGSFFKNPIIEKSHFDSLKSQFSDIHNYPAENNKIKIPAGWLIESLGWKGKQVGRTGSHSQQALVLVNYGGATGQEIEKLSKSIQQSVYQKYQINLETEVNIVR
jgi:UDP-N-acetylmuramate dehydrogenase